jgi:hypothetical protein
MYGIINATGMMQSMDVQSECMAFGIGQRYIRPSDQPAASDSALQHTHLITKHHVDTVLADCILVSMEAVCEHGVQPIRPRQRASPYPPVAFCFV